jgi:hypothetical protein
MFATAPAVDEKRSADAVASTVAHVAPVPVPINALDSAAEADEAVELHTIVCVPRSVGAPVVALIPANVRTCVPATALEVVITNSNGVVVEPVPSVAPDA